MVEKYLIDFDGVILDSQERFNKDMKDNINLYDWIDYLSSIEWNKFLRECEEIDDSMTVLAKLQKYNRLKAIITRIHDFEEGKEKLIYLRERGIEVPVLYTLPEQRKSAVLIPKQDLVLIDDSKENCLDWELNGGKSLLFNPKDSTNDKKIIESLKQLL